jgi:microcompartment protein CcmL/EutN
MVYENKGNIAVVEFKSVSRGIIVTDYMLKAAKVNLVIATSLCPGKYLSIVEGDVEAVTKAVTTADLLGGRHVFSSFMISGVNNDVIKAITGGTTERLQDSIGIIESLQMANLINAADISADSAEIKFLEFRLGKGCGVNSFYIVTGDLDSVNESVKKAADFLREQGALIAYKVIANPDRDLMKWLQPSLCMC